MRGNWNDVRRLAGTFSLSRLKNAILVFFSFFWSKWRRKPLHLGYPLALAFEPTTSCNLRCPECPSGLRSFSRPTGMLQGELFRKTIDELADFSFYLTFYFQGEPYLHPEFLDLVAYAKSKKMYTATSTNAHFLSDVQAEKTVRSGLDRLIISIDGTTQESYEQYRVGGKLEKVLEGTRNVVKWKKKLKSSSPFVIFQFLVVRPNEHQIEEVKALADQLGVDKVVLKTAQIYDYEQGSPLMPLQEKYARYRQKPDGSYEIKNQWLSHCWKMWHSCVITWDGQVVPCCFDKDASHSMGNVSDAGFAPVWQSDAYRHFRASLLRARAEIEMCKNCSEGSLVFQSPA